MGRMLFLAVSLLLPTLAYSQTLVSNPTAITDLQPTGYKCTFAGAAGPVVKAVTAVKNADGSTQIKQDIAALGLPAGIYTSVSCVATLPNVPDSGPSNVITVTIGVLKAPVILITIP